MAWHRLLSDDGPIEDDLPFVSLLCETFGGYPDEAWDAWQRLPIGTLEHILEFRAYRDAKARHDAAERINTVEARKALFGDPWVRRVKAIEKDLQRAKADPHGH